QPARRYDNRAVTGNGEPLRRSRGNVGGPRPATARTVSKEQDNRQNRHDRGNDEKRSGNPQRMPVQEARPRQVVPHYATHSGRKRRNTRQASHAASSHLHTV